jgi:hypothetical protein
VKKGKRKKEKENEKANERNNKRGIKSFRALPNGSAKWLNNQW